MFPSKFIPNYPEQNVKTELSSVTKSSTEEHNNYSGENRLQSRCSYADNDVKQVFINVEESTINTQNFQRNINDENHVDDNICLNKINSQNDFYVEMQAKFLSLPIKDIENQKPEKEDAQLKKEKDADKIDLSSDYHINNTDTSSENKLNLMKNGFNLIKRERKPILKKYTRQNLKNNFTPSLISANTDNNYIYCSPFNCTSHSKAHPLIKDKLMDNILVDKIHPKKVLPLPSNEVLEERPEKNPFNLNKKDNSKIMSPKLNEKNFSETEQSSIKSEKGMETNDVNNSPPNDDTADSFIPTGTVMNSNHYCQMIPMTKQINSPTTEEHPVKETKAIDDLKNTSQLNSCAIDQSKFNVNLFKQNVHASPDKNTERKKPIHKMQIARSMKTRTSDGHDLISEYFAC